MIDREKVIKGLECCTVPQGFCEKCPYETEGFVADCTSELAKDALALLKEQEDEKKRVMKVIWDTLHEGLSIDTIPDQDWVYERIRHRIEDT